MLVIFARLWIVLLCFAFLSLILKMAACPTLLLLGDLGYFCSNSLLVWVADRKVRVQARWRINVSGASGGRNQHFYQGMIFAFGLQGRRPRPAVRGGAVLPFPQAGEPVLESIPLIRHLEALLITYWAFVHRLHHPLPGVQGAWKVPSPVLTKERRGGME